MQLKTDRIDAMLFKKPSGNVRGMVSATTTVGKKAGRVIGRCTLMTDSPAVLDVDLKGKMTPEELEDAMKSLAAFSAKVTELDAGRTR